MTANDLIARSLRLIGVISSGETPSASDYSDSLMALNGMLDLWSAEGLMLSKYSREVFLTTPGKSTYTIGLGGDWQTERPTSIAGFAWTEPEITTTVITPYQPYVPADPGDPLADPVIPPTDEIPEVPEVTETTIKSKFENQGRILNIQEWGSISAKRQESSMVSKMYVHGTAPLETVELYPVPSGQTGIVLYSHKALTTVENGGDDIEVLPAYADMIVYNLALSIA